MKEYCLMTSRGQKILVDRDVWHKYKKFRWFVVKGGYPMAHTIDWEHQEYLHRLIMNPPKGKYVDHISGDKLDNRRSNLRVVTQSQNMHGFNSRKNKHGLRGVTPIIGRGGKLSGTWAAQITVDYRHKYLGSFATKELAHQAYLQAKQTI